MRLLFYDFTLPYLLKDSEYPVGGWAVELDTWLKGLAVHDVQTAVLSWKGSAKYVEENHYCTLLDTYSPDKGLKILKYFYLYIPAMLRAAQAYRPDIILQACSGLNTGILAYIAKCLGVPFVYRVANDMDVDKRVKVRLLRYELLAYKYGLKNAQAIICQNKYQYDALLKKYSNIPLHVVHNPFDISRSKPVRYPRSRRKYIAWVGVFSQQKNMELLLRIATELQSISFHIAGMPSNNMDQDTARTVEQLRKLPNVKFIGYVRRKDLLNFLAGSIALLSTSHYEGFSNTFLEALFAGTPVIASKRVDPDLIITNNRLGLTTDRDCELPGLIRQLNRMDAKRYDQLCMQCYQYVVDHHAPAFKARKLLNILQPLVMV